MHAGQEEDLQVLRAATVRQKPKATCSCAFKSHTTEFTRTRQRHQEHMPLNYRPA